MFAHAADAVGSARSDATGPACRSAPTRRRGDRGRRGERAGRELRARAAAVRVRALGDRIYPVLVCRRCFELTGWLGTGGECDSCMRAAKLRSAFSDPHAGWVDLGSPTTELAKPKRRGRSLGLAWLTRPLETRRRAPIVEWLARVEPGETGP